MSKNPKLLQYIKIEVSEYLFLGLKDSSRYKNYYKRKEVYILNKNKNF